MTRFFDIRKLGEVNWLLVIIVTTLALVGFAMMYSASSGNYHMWAKPQVIRFSVAFVAMLLIAIMPIRTILSYSYLIYFVCVLLLVVVEMWGHKGMGAERWIRLGPLTVQPSELMKIAIILALARYFHGLRLEETRKLIYLIPPLIMIAVPAALILHQPNLGTTTIMVGVATIMLFAAGVKLRYFIIVGLTGLMLMPIGWQFLHDYQKQRVMTFLNPQEDPLGAGYNIMQSMIAIGSGGLTGKGYMQGSQGQLDFLPEKHTDFIFTMLAEEFGFIGCMSVLALYFMLIALGLLIGSRSKNTFGSLMAAGITALLFIHIFINVGMVMGILPVVGVPLPLLSYGGTMMITILLAFGLLLNADVNRDELISRNQGSIA